MQRGNVESVYLRLTTRTIRQIERADDSWKEGAIQGGYWLRDPAPGAEAVLVYSGAIAPEALRSEEHTSELQSLMRISYAVFCLKKKKKRNIIIQGHTCENMRDKCERERQEE